MWFIHHSSTFLLDLQFNTLRGPFSCIFFSSVGRIVCNNDLEFVQ